MMTNRRLHFLSIITAIKGYIWGILWFFSITIIIVASVLPSFRHWEELNSSSLSQTSLALPYIEYELDSGDASISLSTFDFSYLLRLLSTQAEKLNLTLQQIDIRGVKVLSDEVLKQLGVTEYSVIIHVIGEYNSILAWQSEINNTVTTLRFTHWQLQRQQDGALSFKAAISFWSREGTDAKHYAHEKPFQVRENPFTAP